MIIPVLIQWPAGISARRIDTQIASLIDIMPTLLSLADIEIPETNEGADLSPVLAGDADNIGKQRNSFAVNSCTVIYRSSQTISASAGGAGLGGDTAERIVYARCS